MTDNAAPANSIDDYPHKVFAGNLSFKTTEDELKTFFSEAGTVVKVNIITRGTRSLGYGFVAFSEHDECLAAVEKLHKKQLDGREINIEVAKPKAELEAAKKEKAEKKSSTPRKRRFFPKRRGQKKEQSTDDSKDADKEAEGDKKDDASGDKKTQKKKPRRPRTRKDSTTKKPREPRARREPTGAPSKTTVFVANLPFSLTDETFAAVFKDFKIKTAKVVVRRGTGRSKGFGFVEVEDEEEQQKLLSAPAFVSEGRELNIKVALSEEKPAGGESAAVDEAQA